MIFCNVGEVFDRWSRRKKAPEIAIAVRDYNARNEYELSIKVDEQVETCSLTVVSVPITLSHKLLEIFLLSSGY